MVINSKEELHAINGNVQIILKGDRMVKAFLTYRFNPITGDIYYEIVPRGIQLKEERECEHNNICYGRVKTEKGLTIELLMCADCFKELQLEIKAKK